MIVIVSGLPGSGKTSIVKAIQKRFKLKTVYASVILKELMEKELKEKTSISVEKGFWETKKGRNFALKRLKNLDFDKKLDKKLLKTIKSHDNLVVDSRTMPWLSKKGIKIFLKASEKERIKRIAERDNITLKKAKTAISRLGRDKKIYKKLYGIRFGEDFEPFNLVLDTTNLSLKDSKKIVFSFLRVFYKKQRLTNQL